MSVMWIVLRPKISRPKTKNEVIPTKAYEKRSIVKKQKKMEKLDKIEWKDMYRFQWSYKEKKRTQYSQTHHQQMYKLSTIWLDHSHYKEIPFLKKKKR